MPSTLLTSPDEAFELLSAAQCGQFEFKESLPISAKSRFGDSKWDYTDDSNLRLKATDNQKLRFDWERVTAGSVASSRNVLLPHQKFIAILPFEMVEDLRRGFFLLAMFPQLARGSRLARPRKAVTIVGLIRQAVKFFSYCYLQGGGASGISRLRTLSDFNLPDIQKGIENYPYNIVEVKSVLAILADEYIQTNLKHGRMKWNYADLKTLKWPPIKEKEPIETLPDYLFALLSNRSSELVAEFLTLLGKQPKDPHALPATGPQDIRRWTRFKEIFANYSQRRVDCHNRRDRTSNNTKEFIREFQTAPQEILRFLTTVHCAAQNIILLYTGMRYSDAALIRTGCLAERDGMHFIKSSLIKSVPSNMPIDLDEWVAIDVVQDAVSALEELSRCTLNPFLFSSFRTLDGGEESNPLSNGGLISRLSEYLRAIDTENKWRGWSPSPHQYRHGLIRQLARAEVGLPYITRQLKHCYTLLSERSNKISAVSTIYGMQKERLVGNATGLSALRDAHFDVIQDLYGEGRKFAGGGAALHVSRTEAFFKGIGLEGKRREEYLAKLAAAGGGPIKIGITWCVRNHVDPRKLREDPPPCIGDLNCNPHACKHSVVPESSKPDVIARYRYAAKQLASPDQTHVKSHWESQLRAYSAMLQQLGVDPQSLQASVMSLDTIAKVLADD